MNNLVLALRAEVDALQRRVKALEDEKDKREQVKIADIGTWASQKTPVIYRKGADRGKS